MGSTDRGTVLDLRGRPGSPQHPEGTEALTGLVSLLSDPERAALSVEEARHSLAALVGVVEEEVVFTSGGSEASNAALKGLALGSLDRPGPRRIIVSAAEHAPVLHAARGLERLGFETVLIPIDAAGRVDAGRFAEELRRGATLAALQWANDELGTMQPVRGLALVAAEHGIPLHTDATAAVGWVDVPLDEVPVATASLSSRRMGGPPGIGALIVRTGWAWLPLLDGGLEENGRRAGMLHPALIAGCGLSAAAARERGKERAARATRLRDALAAETAKRLPDARVNGDPTARLPGHLHLTVPGAEGEALLLALEAMGILAETGSACADGAGLPSRLLRATGMSPAEAASSILFRLTASHDDQVPVRVAGALATVADRLRTLSR